MGRLQKGEVYGGGGTTFWKYFLVGSKTYQTPVISVSKIFYGRLGVVLRIFGDFRDFFFFYDPWQPLEVGNFPKKIPKK